MSYTDLCLLLPRSPGRFFAANELKALLAFIVTSYDFKLAEGGSYPENLYIAENIVPNPTAELMFRKRQPLAGSA